MYSLVVGGDVCCRNAITHLTLRLDVLVALQQRVEGVSSTGEEEGHVVLTLFARPSISVRGSRAKVDVARVT